MAKFLVAIDDVSAEETVRQLYTEAPFFLDLYLLKAELLHKQKQFIDEHAVLSMGIQQFPYSRRCHYALAVYYLNRHQEESFHKQVQEAEKRFEQDPIFLRKLRFLQKNRSLFLALDVPYQDELCAGDMKLENPPERIKHLVQWVTEKQPNEAFYIVGGAVRSMILNQNLPIDKDIDLIFFKPPSPRLGFVTTKLENVYTQCHPQFHKIDLYVTPEEEHFKRDFTIGCVFYDKDGQLHDPTGTGVNDIKAMVLRTVKHPALCFLEDPIRVLRAIKFMILGYKPTAEVAQVLKSFTFPDQTNIEHFHDVRDKLFHEYGVAFSDLLEEYNLTDKVFPENPNCPDSDEWVTINIPRVSTCTSALFGCVGTEIKVDARELKKEDERLYYASLRRS